MKKVYNRTDTMVDDMLDGYISAFPHVKRSAYDKRIIVRNTHVKNADKKVTLVIGNGSGHEPIAMGFVGRGMLDANVVGDVFAAPSADLIVDGIKAVNGRAGTILLISQHSGDVINGRAGVMLAHEENIEVHYLLMYDDISSAPKHKAHNRRGAPGTLFIYKMLGQACEEGQDMQSLLKLGADIRDKTVTLSAALRSGISPLTGKPMFNLPEDEVFLGMGIHGEPGIGRLKICLAEKLVAEMMERLLADRPIADGGRVLVIVNGMGGTTQMELLTVWREVNLYLKNRNITALCPMIGSFVTTQEMGGFSISLLEPTDAMIRLWTADTDTPYFPRIHKV